MSDRFDSAVERKPRSKTDAAPDGVAGVPRTEVIAGSGRRRRWSHADKARIVSESLKPGASVSEVTVRISGAVDAKALVAVLRAVRRAS
jgi:hypothetical protein